MPESITAEQRQVPLSLLVTVWAIAAGIVGYPINIQLNGIPGYLRTLISRLFIQWVGESHGCIVQTKKDVNNLLGNLKVTSLAIFTEAALYSRAEWQLENTFDKNDLNKRPVPALLLFDTECPDDPTGPLLRVHCSSHEIKTLGDWLVDSPVLPEFPPVIPQAVVRFDPRNKFLFRWTDLTLLGADWRILQSLLLGCRLCDGVANDSQSLTIGVDTYGAVTRVIRSPIFQPPGCSFSPRLSYMAARANIFLEMQFANHPDPNRTGEGRSDFLHFDDLITQREMVDLGNPKGQTVRNLVKFLMKDQDHGAERFNSCGLSIQQTIIAWPSESPEECCKFLLPWTAKQVRSEFKKACDLKLITPSLAPGNRAYQYRLPESFIHPLPSFRNTPAPDSLVFPLGTIEPAAPTGLRPAQEPGHTEVVTE